MDEAVLLQAHMKGIANVPLPRYVDCLHSIVASGGFLQYQFNHLLSELKKLGISPEAVDECVCILPRSSTTLKAIIFKDRVVNHSRKH